VLDPASIEVRDIVQRARDFLTTVNARPFLDQLESAPNDIDVSREGEASAAAGAPTRT